MSLILQQICLLSYPPLWRFIRGGGGGGGAWVVVGGAGGGLFAQEIKILAPFVGIDYGGIAHLMCDLLANTAI